MKVKTLLKAAAQESIYCAIYNVNEEEIINALKNKDLETKLAIGKVNKKGAAITGAGLATGLNIGEQAADELLYLCLEEVPQFISEQSYSTDTVGPWSIGVV